MQLTFSLPMSSAAVYACIYKRVYSCYARLCGKVTLNQAQVRFGETSRWAALCILDI